MNPHGTSREVSSPRHPRHDDFTNKCSARTSNQLIVKSLPKILTNVNDNIKQCMYEWEIACSLAVPGGANSYVPIKLFPYLLLSTVTTSVGNSRLNGVARVRSNTKLCPVHSGMRRLAT